VPYTGIRPKSLSAKSKSSLNAHWRIAVGEETETNMTKIGVAAAALLAAVTYSGAASAQDAASGEDIFQGRCGSCHSTGSGGPSGGGPNLFGVVGSEIGGRDVGWRFSSALGDSADTWTEANLDAWLESPSGFLPGNRMPFGGLSSSKDRSDVIAYLNTLK